MNIITNLQFGDNVNGPYNREYLVVGINTHFFRSDDGFNPNSKAKCTFIELTVVGTSQKDTFLQEWLYSNNFYSGRIVQVLSEDSASGSFKRDRIIRFSEARCFSFSERYDIASSSQRLYDLKLKVNHCDFDGVLFHNGSF